MIHNYNMVVRWHWPDARQPAKPLSYSAPELDEELFK